MKNKDIAEMFASGKHQGKVDNLFIDGNAIYSYGDHFPIAIRIWVGDEIKYLWNSDKYSRTTSRHQFFVLNAIGGKDKILKELNTQQMKRVISLGFTNVKELMAEALDGGN
jgi:hypothetical protein